MASARKNQNAIWNLKDDSGNWVTDDLGLKALGVCHFEHIFADDSSTNLLARLSSGLSGSSPPLLLVMILMPLPALYIFLMWRRL